MFLIENKEPDYVNLLKDITINEDKKFECVCHLIRFRKYHDLFVNYKHYESLLESDYYLEKLVYYYFLTEENYTKARMFIIDYLKIYDRFPTGYFSKKYKFLLKLREQNNFSQLNFILENNL